MTRMPTFKSIFTCHLCLFLKDWNFLLLTILRTFLNSEKLLFEKPPSQLKDVALLVRVP
jgi:hypothetical protein